MHTDSQVRPLRVDIIGATRRTIDTLEMVFTGPGQGSCLIVNSTVAEVVVMDVDCAEASRVWPDYRTRFPDRPAILLSLRELPSDTEATVLRKPLKSGQLLEALDRIRQRLDADDTPGTQAATEPLLRTWSASIGGTVSPPKPALARGDADPASPATPFRDAPAHTPTRHEAPPTSKLNMAPTPIGNPASSGKPAHPTARRPVQDRTVRTTQTTQVYADPAVDEDNASGVSGPHSRGSEDAQWKPVPLPRPSDRVYADSCGVHKDIDPTNPEHVSSLMLPLQGRLLAFLKQGVREAFQDNVVVEVRLPKGFFIVDPHRMKVMSSLDDASLKASCAIAWNDHDVQLRRMPAEGIAPAENGLNNEERWTHFESVLWKAALWTYQGRLPAGIALDTRVYLAHWPNLTRLAEVPDAMRIAALWTEHPMSLLHTADALKIPQRHVFSFFSAAYTLGIAGQAKRESDELFDSGVVPRSEKRPVIKRMMKHLRSLINT